MTTTLAAKTIRYLAEERGIGQLPDIGPGP
jgi:hypothetical protein